MEKWLSFIVPVYNVEDYLSECVDSLLNQDVHSDVPIYYHILILLSRKWIIILYYKDKDVMCVIPNPTRYLKASPYFLT